MIEGITILNQTELESVDWWLLIACVVIGALVAVGLMVWLDAEIISGILGGVVTVILFIVLPVTYPNGHYEYECLIDESVSMTDVYEKYKVVEQRGEIWILRDKED